MKRIKVGKILNTHGLRGDIVLFLENRETTQIKKNSKIIIGQKEYTVEKFNNSSKKIIFKLAGVDSIENASELKGLEVFIERDQLESCGDNEFYLNDILGFEVYTETNKYLGKIIKFYDNGIQDIAVIKGKVSMDYPLLEHLILAIDLEANKMTVKELTLV